MLAHPRWFSDHRRNTGYFVPAFERMMARRGRPVDVELARYPVPDDPITTFRPPLRVYPRVSESVQLATEKILRGRRTAEVMRAFRADVARGARAGRR